MYSKYPSEEGKIYWDAQVGCIMQKELNKEIFKKEDKPSKYNKDDGKYK